MLSDSCLAPASWRAGLGGARGKEQWKEKKKLVLHPADLPDEGLLAVVKAWHCGLWCWQCVVLAVKEDLRIRRAAQAPSSFRTLTLIFTP